jgi:hypothetical protein
MDASMTETSNDMKSESLLPPEKRIKLSNSPSTSIDSAHNSQDTPEGTHIPSIDSTILNYNKLKRELILLCKLSGKQFKLIYRATRDGFEAKSFHTKCDNQPKTLTVIQSANGNIFGGFANVAWESSATWKKDPHAFIFSLTNSKFCPQFMPVKACSTRNIGCAPLWGPVFGRDILVVNNSNSHNSSYSELGHSYDFKLFPFGSADAESFIDGFYNFKTSEIEVFCLT